MRTHITGVVSLIPPCHNKYALVGRATGNHLMNSTSLEKKLGALFTGFCYARIRIRDVAVVAVGIEVKPCLLT